MLRRLFWLYFFFISSLPQFSNARRTLTTTPCLQSYFIKACQSLEPVCVCSRVSTVIPEMAEAACQDGGAALRFLASECRVPIRPIISTSPFPIFTRPSNERIAEVISASFTTSSLLATTSKYPNAGGSAIEAVTGVGDQALLAPLLPTPSIESTPTTSITTPTTSLLSSILTTPISISTSPPNLTSRPAAVSVVVAATSPADGESMSTKANMRTAIIIVLSISLIAIIIFFIYLWYRGKMGPGWYKFHQNLRWDFAAWRKEQEKKRMEKRKKRRRAKGSIITFMGPPPEYETKLDWGVAGAAMSQSSGPVMTALRMGMGGPGAGLKRPEMVQVQGMRL